jgi:ferredoxin, 2Fe-2S
MQYITLELVTIDGLTHTLQAAVGRSLMQAAVAAGVQDIAADCGGCLSCATCHVFIDADWAPRLPAPSVDEHAMLDMTGVPRQPHSRLSCQIALVPALHGLRVHLPPSQY